LASSGEIREMISTTPVDHNNPADIPPRPAP
jgi:hypothetical protein